MKSIIGLPNIARFAFSIILLASLFLPVRSVWAGVDSWTSTGPSDVIGRIAVAPSDNQTIYAIGQLGLWKSDDGGNNWSLIPNVKLSLDAPIVVDPNDPAILYSSGQDDLRGIIKSTDGGAGWAVLHPNVNATAFAVDLMHPNVVFAGIVTGGASQILKSTDEGDTWSAATEQFIASPGLPYISGIAIEPTNVNVVYAAIQLYHGGVVIRSADGGASWTTLTDASQVPLMSPTALAVSPASAARARIYVGLGIMGSKALLVSPDSGATWQNFTSTLPSAGGAITGLVAPNGDDTVIASIGGSNPQTQEQGNVYISRDAGDSWTQLAPLTQNVNRLTWASSTKTLYVGTSNGVWQYTVPSGGFKQTVNARFRGYYDSHDGWRVLGTPISFGVSIGQYFSQYFEKGRIEDHTGESSDPNWQFMYGLLVDELQQGGLNLPVGGDTSTVTYATIRNQAAESLRVAPPSGFTGGTAQRLDGSVFVPFTSDLSPAPGHNIPAAFWAYINRNDLFPGGWLHDIGLPISEPMSAIVDKGSVKGRQITVQAFQRTILTHDPLNPPEWQVERANVGADYRKAFPGDVAN